MPLFPNLFRKRKPGFEYVYEEYFSTGQSYRVIRAFTDENNQQVEQGIAFKFVKRDYLPYDDGYTLLMGPLESTAETETPVAEREYFKLYLRGTSEVWTKPELYFKKL